MSFRVALVAFLVAVALAAFALGKCGNRSLCDEIPNAHGCPAPTGGH